MKNKSGLSLFALLCCLSFPSYANQTDQADHVIHIGQTSLPGLDRNSGRTASPSPNLPPPGLSEVLNGAGGFQSNIGPKFNAIREAGLAYGSCAGMKRRNFELRERLNRDAHYLDTIYNFHAISIRADTPDTGRNIKSSEVDGYIVPPVLIELRGFYDKKADNLIRTFDRTYRIHRQAYFTATMPSWREYLLLGTEGTVVCRMPPIDPEKTGNTSAWRNGVEEGWRIGYAMADKSLKDNFGRLKRDFEGMILYHKLLRLGMISRPIASSAVIGITGDSKTMNVGEVIYRITAMPEFNKDDSQWK